jgi:acetoin utilization deacetylase AcuC-like enzyme|uniref:Histone deacetylase n=1 Tax=Desulfobacca acetoxidans TaxID=60893 RepID=A0A7C3WIE2_9BACT
MKKVGIYYHPSFSRKSYMTIGNRLRDFPEALDELLRRPNVKMFTSPRVSEELILKVHAPEMIQMVARDPFCSTAYESVGGVVAAMEALAKGELDRAFCFIGAGGHHAGYRQFWGACCFNDVVIALTHVREISTWRRFAIVDTDAHHGDGTRALVRDDPEVLHLCFCGSDYVSPDGTKIDVDVYRFGWGAAANREYVEAVRRQLPRLPPFKPDLLIWYYGFDTHTQDYGSLGLTEEAYFEICDLMISLANQCGAPLQVVLGGGSLPHLATATIPEIIRRLAETD